MLGGRIDRDAWAQEVEALIIRFDPGPRRVGNKSAFAKRVGLTTKTLERWSNRATDISMESARQVLDRLGLPQQEQVDLLTRVGYFVPGMPAQSLAPDPSEDFVVRRIMADKSLTERQRAELVRIQIQRIEADRERRLQEYLQLRELFGGQTEAS